MTALTLSGQSSVLSSGKWYKISVDVDAVHKMDYNFLKSMGLNPDKIDPRKIQLFAGLNEMLPQANNKPRPNDLQELSIYIKGEEDGKFNGGDYILFFAQGPDSYKLLPANGIFQYENNLFTDKNYYFMTVGSNDGQRMGSTPNIPGAFPVVAEFDDFDYYENDQYNDLHSGRHWYGELFDSKTEYTIRFEIPGIIDGSPIKLVSNVMGQSFSASSFQLFLNDINIGQQQVPPAINAPYATRGFEVTDTLIINASTVNAPSRLNQDVKLRFIKATSGRSIGYLDNLLLQTKRRLALYGDQKIFHALKSLEQPISQFSITGTFSDGMVWNVTDPFHSKFQEITFDAGTTTFAAASASIQKYLVVSNKSYLTPIVEGAVSNQNLHGISSLDFLIITAPEFQSQAERLAEHRRSVNGILTQVVTTTQVYNEFSGGKQDITALRDLASYLFNKGSGIKNVLLFGRGSYDYKNRLSFNKNFVPTYESRNSLSPLETYSSDDYIGFLEASEGNWGENPPEPHTLDIGVGRLPAKKIEEATTWVDKIVEYEHKNWGGWRKEILFVADDGDFNIHQSQADQMATTLEKDHPEVNTLKLYLDAFKQVSSPSGQLSPDATAALNSSIRDGAGIVNYTGHGSELQWMQERILDQVSIDKWKSAPRYPMLVTATCEFGRNDDPGLISTAELSLFKKKNGAIGLVTTTRPVYSSTNFTLNKAFYLSLFVRDQGKFRDWGTIFRDTKNNSISGVSNRNFSMLGDPSLHPPLPSSELIITGITNLTSGSDTLKALSKVKVTGRVYTNGFADMGYKGTVSTTLYDKLTSVTTRGDENAPFNFTTRDNALFRGQASIRDGEFEIQFVIPKSIDLTVGPGKMSLYGFSNVSNSDAMGVNNSVKIGAIEKSPGFDSSGPLVDLFMGDTTFISGGLAGTNSRIVAILSDENGIDISNFNSQNDITATMDDSVSFNLNKYYQADVGSYTRGKVNYPIDGLKPGKHMLTLRATDTFGNTSSGFITFFVSDQNGIQIEQWLNYPNPFSGSTTFHFKHNRSGEDLEAVVTVFDRMGKVVLFNTYQIYGSSYKVDLSLWDGASPDGTKLGEGLYLMKLSLRSLLDGTKNEKIAKVIILN